jgi:hypothetical protein
MVFFTNAVIDPRTMMIKHTDTFVTGIAVPTPLSSDNFTIKAKPLTDLILLLCLIISFFNQLLKIKIRIFFYVAWEFAHNREEHD